jgi:hypothetical protein
MFEEQRCGFRVSPKEIDRQPEAVSRMRKMIDREKTMYVAAGIRTARLI